MCKSELESLKSSVSGELGSGARGTGPARGVLWIIFLLALGSAVGRVLEASLGGGRLDGGGELGKRWGPRLHRAWVSFRPRVGNRTQKGK